MSCIQIIKHLSYGQRAQSVDIRFYFMKNIHVHQTKNVMMPSKKLCDKDYIERSYIVRIERLPQLRELPRKKFRRLNIRNHEVYIQAFVQHCIESRHSSCCILIPDTFNMVVRYTENPSSDPLLSLMFSLS